MPSREPQINAIMLGGFLLMTVTWQVLSSSLLLYNAFSRATWDNWEKFSGTLEHFATVFALIIGAWWAYSRFIQGRIGKPRLEQALHAKVALFGSTHCVKISSIVKNVGLTKVSIDKQGSGLDVYAWTPMTNVEYTSIAEETLIFLPNNDASILKLDLVTVSPESDKEWHCITIVEMDSVEVQGEGPSKGVENGFSKIRRHTKNHQRYGLRSPGRGRTEQKASRARSKKSRN